MAKVLLDTHSKIAGVTMKNDNNQNIQELLSMFKPNDKLTFIREPNNPYDKNAIKLYANNTHIGYVKGELAKTVAPIIDNGGSVHGYITEITGGKDGKDYGCNYKITAFEKVSSSNIVKDNNQNTNINDNIMLGGKWYKRSTVKIFQTIWKILAIIILLISLICFILNVFMGILMLLVSIFCFVMSKTYGKIYINGGQETIKSSSINLGRIVYISKDGKKYHYNKNCINGKVYNSITENQAKSSGLTRCDKCCK